MKIKAILSLMVIPPLMMELLVGNLTLAAFFHPLILIILFIGYSLPVLLLRELSIKWQLGTRGLFLLGIIYGILNEGLGAKTLLSQTNVPTPSFNGYGFYGINFPFSAYVLVIQALVSVVIPIKLVHHFFPAIKQENWFGNITKAIFAMLSATGISLIFFSPTPIKADPLFFPLFILIMGVLAFIARSLPRDREDPDTPCKMQVLQGMAFVLVYGIGLDLTANLKVPLSVFFFLWGAITAWFSRYFSQLLFGLGVYLSFGVTGTINLVLLKGHVEGLVTGFLFEAWLFWVAWKYLKQTAPQNLETL